MSSIIYVKNYEISNSILEIPSFKKTLLGKWLIDGKEVTQEQVELQMKNLATCCGFENFTCNAVSYEYKKDSLSFEGGLLQGLKISGENIQENITRIIIKQKPSTSIADSFMFKKTNDDNGNAIFYSNETVTCFGKNNTLGEIVPGEIVLGMDEGDTYIWTDGSASKKELFNGYGFWLTDDYNENIKTYGLARNDTSEKHYQTNTKFFKIADKYINVVTGQSNEKKINEGNYTYENSFNYGSVSGKNLYAWNMSDSAIPIYTNSSTGTIPKISIKNNVLTITINDNKSSYMIPSNMDIVVYKRDCGAWSSNTLLDYVGKSYTPFSITGGSQYPTNASGWEPGIYASAIYQALGSKRTYISLLLSNCECIMSDSEKNDDWKNQKDWFLECNYSFKNKYGYWCHSVSGDISETSVDSLSFTSEETPTKYKDLFEEKDVVLTSERINDIDKHTNSGGNEAEISCKHLTDSFHFYQHSSQGSVNNYYYKVSSKPKLKYTLNNFAECSLFEAQKYQLKYGWVDAIYKTSKNETEDGSSHKQLSYVSVKIHSTCDGVGLINTNDKPLIKGDLGFVQVRTTTYPYQYELVDKGSGGSSGAYAYGVLKTSNKNSNIACYWIFAVPKN